MRQKAVYGDDDLDRLMSAAITPSGQAAITEAYTYSATGNIVSKTLQEVGQADANGTKSYTYGDPRHLHAVTAMGGDTFSYDAAGNMVSETRGGQAITYGYDGFNRLTTITNGSGTTTYVYGAGYERVQKKLPNGKTTTYFDDLAELDEAGNWTDHLFLGSRRVATVDKTGTYYHVSDHLSDIYVSSSLQLEVKLFELRFC